MASPINAIKMRVKNIAAIGDKVSHQELKLEIPWDKSCPQLGVGSGKPNPKKSRDARTAIPAITVKGRKEITGVKEFGSI